MAETSGLCEGCQRTLEEIGGWSRYSDEQKRVVWARIEERRRLTIDPGSVREVEQP